MSSFLLPIFLVYILKLCMHNILFYRYALTSCHFSFIVNHGYFYFSRMYIMPIVCISITKYHVPTKHQLAGGRFQGGVDSIIDSPGNTGKYDEPWINVIKVITL